MQIITGKQPKPLKVLVYGPEGVGKSSLAKDFPKPVFIDVEGGTSRLDVARTPRPNTWAEFIRILTDLAKDTMGFETIVVDTADWAEKLAIKQVCAENGYKAMGGNNDYGASYNHLAALWSSLLNQLEADFIETGKANVVFLAHSTTKKFELPEEEGQFDRYQLDLEKKVAPLLKAWSDMILFVNYKTIVNIDEKAKTAKGAGGTRRVMFAEHTAAFDAKNRDGLPREMDLSFASLAKCFHVTKAAPVPVPMPAPTPTPAPEPASTTEVPALSPQHRAFQKLLETSGVTYSDVLGVLVAKRRYPEGTPMENIDPQFIDGFICPHWEKILDAIKGGTKAA